MRSGSWGKKELIWVVKDASVGDSAALRRARREHVVSISGCHCLCLQHTSTHGPQGRTVVLKVGQRTRSLGLRGGKQWGGIQSERVPD